MILPGHLEKFNYGSVHPIQLERIQYAIELIRAYGLDSIENAIYTTPTPAVIQDLNPFHDEEYISVLREANDGVYREHYQKYGLGPGDNPVFEGVFDLSMMVVGCTMTATRLIGDGRAYAAFNMTGGMHHAMRGRASGFCFVNDVVMAIDYFLKKKMKVMYVDIDAHHGDGVQAAYYDTDKVLTLSFHESGRSLFPGTGFTDETGEGKGKGYTINVPLKHGSDDATFIRAWGEIFPPVIDKFKPDVLVGLVGCDMMLTDPLTNMNLTSNGYVHAIEKMKEVAKRWLLLGGGGYNPYNTSRLWTLAWAIMNDIELPDELPESFLERAKKEGFDLPGLRDMPLSLGDWQKQEIVMEADRSTREIKQEVFPLLKIKAKRKALDDFMGW